MTREDHCKAHPYRFSSELIPSATVVVDALWLDLRPVKHTLAASIVLHSLASLVTSCTELAFAATLDNTTAGYSVNTAGSYPAVSTSTSLHIALDCIAAVAINSASTVGSVDVLGANRFTPSRFASFTESV